MNELIVFDTSHTRAINDCELDYYSKKLATCSNDNTVKIFDVSLSKEPVCIAEIRDHSSAVWKVCWSHPKYGSLLASCSYDKSVIIYKEVNINKYEMIYLNNEHKSSVNYIEWSPHEYGLHLGCASSDGYLSIISYNLNKDTNEGHWTKSSIKAHLNGTACLSWEKPFNSLGNNKHLNDNNDFINSFKLVTGGYDNQVIIWTFDNNTKEYHKIFQMNDKPHNSLVRDVSWRPNLSNTTNMIASCSDEQIVILWFEDISNNRWKNGQVIKVDQKIHKISWSPNGTILAIACSGDNAYLYKENMEGLWVEICNLTDDEKRNIQEDNASGGGANANSSLHMYNSDVANNIYNNANANSSSNVNTNSSSNANTNSSSNVNTNSSSNYDGNYGSNPSCKNLQNQVMPNIMNYLNPLATSNSNSNTFKASPESNYSTYPNSINSAVPPPPNKFVCNTMMQEGANPVQNTPNTFQNNLYGQAMPSDPPPPMHVSNLVNNRKNGANQQNVMQGVPQNGPPNAQQNYLMMQNANKKSTSSAILSGDNFLMGRNMNPPPPPPPPSFSHEQNNSYDTSNLPSQQGVSTNQAVSNSSHFASAVPPGPPGANINIFNSTNSNNNSINNNNRINDLNSKNNYNNMHNHSSSGSSQINNKLNFPAKW
ncbi:protein transport protein SEC13, putative [Plasmodium malariae]|uniref:Protein transport protein SEC13, putative n=1 Tax=Plasmodium malariae TaxID=5858 RepID=A0A1C3L323_PLAMA|nr:protein transport protein SEC13, putative [Plasmodium malariae]